MEKSFVHHHDKHQGRAGNYQWRGLYWVRKTHGQMTMKSWTSRTLDVFRGTHGLVYVFRKLTEDPGSQALGHSLAPSLQQLAGGSLCFQRALARFAKFKLPSSRPDSGPGAESYMRTVASWGWVIIGSWLAFSNAGLSSSFSPNDARWDSWRILAWSWM